MIKVRKAKDRGHADHGWLDTWHTFSFADYYDPDWMGFRSLRVINDDTVAAGGGFGTHPHRDMEIITYVLSGALEHKDSMGNGRIIRPGEVQYMAAGTGVAHSEFNPSKSEPVHFMQIWIKPDRTGAKPDYADRSFATAKAGALTLIASKDARQGSMRINQEADVFIAKFEGEAEVGHELRPGRHAWVQVAEGELTLNGQKLNAGDGAAITDEKRLDIITKGPAQALVFDLN
jgi:redox-sensitive bicupin YhaK (pirin superfamily)